MSVVGLTDRSEMCLFGLGSVVVHPDQQTPSQHVLNAHREGYRDEQERAQLAWVIVIDSALRRGVGGLVGY